MLLDLDALQKTYERRARNADGFSDAGIVLSLIAECRRLLAEIDTLRQAAPRRKYNLEDLVAQMTPENRHEETDFGRLEAPTAPEEEP